MQFFATKFGAKLKVLRNFFFLLFFNKLTRLEKISPQKSTIHIPKRAKQAQTQKKIRTNPTLAKSITTNRT